MELVIHPSSGGELDDVIRRITHNQGVALLIGNSSVWTTLRETITVGSFAVRPIDLRQVDRLSTVVAQVSGSGAEVLALRDSPKLEADIIRALIERLYAGRVPVVFHMDTVERLRELMIAVDSGANRVVGGRGPEGERPLSPWTPTGPPLALEAIKPMARPENARSVNTLVVLPGGKDPARRLGRGASYEVLLNIGPWVAGSLLSDLDARWPDARLPDGDLDLRAMLTMDGMAEPLVATFVLPAAGPSDWLRFPITTPDLPRVWTGELVVYYQVVPVHSQQLILPVGLDGSPHARLLGRLTRDFADLGPLKDRSASMVVSPGGSRVLVNGVRFADNPASISADAANGVTRSARQQLYDMHLGTDGVSKLDKDFGKDADQFEADLAALARLGWQAFEKLFHDNTFFDTLPRLIRLEAQARHRPPVLNVADPTMSEPDRDPPLPWSLMYDMYISGTEPYQVCESLRELGPGGSGAAVPVCCPHEATHGKSTLCPFGFWGLSCVIEQPAGTGKLTWTVLNRPQPPALAMFVDPTLDEALTRTHVDRLRGRLPAGTVTDSTITSSTDLAKQLAGETMDVAYLYCHGGYSQLSTEDKPTTMLRFGESRVLPSDVAGWRATVWKLPHWPLRKPLVVLNGCHTVEETTATLGNFVDAFTNRAEASGVIGTEVTVEQGMAGWAMEELLHGLIAGGASAGEALRDVRWRMINRGNVMGLAYTLYSVAGLRLRPPA